MRCPHCKSKYTVKCGYKVTVRWGKRPRRQCQDCGRSFYAKLPRKTAGGKG